MTRATGTPGEVMSGSWEDYYRDKWTWDKVTWGTHCVDCYPGNCPYRVYVKDGRIVREEPAATFTTIEQGVPDWNPTGCQKGAAWSRMLRGEDRILHPLRRVGERGEGRWEQISWDEAVTAIADAMLDAMVAAGPETILRLGTTEGGAQTIALANNLFFKLGATVTDVIAEVGDINLGMYATFGRLGQCSSHDDWFHSEFIVIWGNNPAQSNIPTFHFLSEARYNGSEIVTIAPDYSPSAVHADYFVPVRPGTDAALAMAICNVIVAEGLVDAPFVKEQTDLPLLVRTDTGRFLRQSDMCRDGSPEIFHFFDTAAGSVAEAPLTLDLGGMEPALEGCYPVTLEDGRELMVEPVFARLRRTLEAYTPEKASAICGVHPGTIRMLARKVGARRTRIICGWTFCKSYHGDLIERAMCLVLGLTGNWGKQGAGIRGIGSGMFDGLYIQATKPETGQRITEEMRKAEEERVRAILASDPTLTQELLQIREISSGSFNLGSSPPFFFWYNQCGYREIYNNPAFNDPGMRRSFDEYVTEAIEKGWWEGFDHPTVDAPHRVLFNIGANPMRMQRGGQRILLQNLWPTLDMIVTMDFRLSTTALYSDFVLPMAQHHEKTNTNYTTNDTMFAALADKAVDPPGEARSEYQATLAIARALVERARVRGIEQVTARGGRVVRLDHFYDELTLGGALADEDAYFDEAFRDSAVLGTMPAGTSLESMRRTGWVRHTGLGSALPSLGQASDVKPDETFAPFRWQTERKEPYPTLTRRAQFYIDHEWYLEAGEGLPLHKEAPLMGGDHPFVLTSGHPRAGVNSMHSTDKTMMATTRGTPVAHINDRDAEQRGIRNGEDIRLFNDHASMLIQARVTPAVRPGSVIVYSGFEPYLSPGWTDLSNLETGMVKWLHLAGGYGHLDYTPMRWRQPTLIDRGIRVDYQAAVPQRDPDRRDVRGSIG